MVARLSPGCPSLPILVCRVSVHLSARCMWGCVRLGAKPDLAGGKGTVPGMSRPAQGECPQDVPASARDCPQDVLASLGKCCRGMALGRVENPRAGFKHCQLGLAVSSPEEDSSLNFSWTGIFLLLFNFYFLPKASPSTSWLQDLGSSGGGQQGQCQGDTTSRWGHCLAGRDAGHRAHFGARRGTSHPETSGRFPLWV